MGLNPRIKDERSMGNLKAFTSIQMQYLTMLFAFLIDQSFWVWRMGQGSLDGFKVTKQPMMPQEWFWKSYTLLCVFQKNPVPLIFSPSEWLKVHMFFKYTCVFQNPVPLIIQKEETLKVHIFWNLCFQTCVPLIFRPSEWLKVHIPFYLVVVHMCRKKPVPLAIALLKRCRHEQSHKTCRYEPSINIYIFCVIACK